jgi:chemotaxis methyl-accepting protein methylase
MRHPRAEESLKEKGIEFMEHSIVDAPLPRKVDLIRFAAVARYLSEAQVERALRNIHASLNEGGILLNERYAYRKSGDGFTAIYKGLGKIE